jgi:hypothetical protein
VSTDPHSGLDAPPSGAPPYPALSFDPEPYAQYLDDCELTEAQKQEFLEALWSILVAFVDLGFSVHPVQQALEGVNTSSAAVEPDSATMLGCKKSFEATSKGKTARARAEERNDA